MRIAAHVLAFDVSDVLPAMIDNIGPHVEQIYVAYSEIPWTYNPDARDTFRNPTDLSIIETCTHYDKVRIIHGEWESDEDQRNACVSRARKDGFDYLIVQDADEFVFSGEAEAAIREMENNPEIDLFRCHWITFWKSTRYALVNREGIQRFGTPEYAINLKNGVHFVDRRKTNAATEQQLDLTVFHLSQVGSDDRVRTKINTWSHSHEMDPQRWYKTKWLRWNPSVRNLHPVRPATWMKAAPYNGPLPQVLVDWPHNNEAVYRESPIERIVRVLRDRLLPLRVFVGRVVRSAKRRMVG